MESADLGERTAGRPARDSSLDAMRGFAITAVVVGHVLMYAPHRGWLLTLILRVVYLFNVQSFAFVSGYLATRFDLRSRTSALIVPLIAWTTVYALSAGRSAVGAFEGTARAVFTGGTNLWFLWALFGGLCILAAFGRHHKLLIVLSVVWGILWRLVPAATGVRTVGYLLPFLVMGREFRRAEDARGRFSSGVLLCGVPIFCFLVYARMQLPAARPDDLFLFSIHQGVTLLMSCFACVGLLGVSRTINGRALGVMASLGVASIGIYGFNSLIILRANPVFQSQTRLQLPILIVAVLGASYLLTRLVGRVPVLSRVLLAGRSRG